MRPVCIDAHFAFPSARLESSPLSSALPRLLSVCPSHFVEVRCERNRWFSWNVVVEAVPLFNCGLLNLTCVTRSLVVTFRTVLAFSTSCDAKHWFSDCLPQLKNTSSQVSPFLHCCPHHHNRNGRTVLAHAPLTPQAHFHFALDFSLGDPPCEPCLWYNVLCFSFTGQAVLLVSCGPHIKHPLKSRSEIQIFCHRSLELLLK